MVYYIFTVSFLPIIERNSMLTIVRCLFLIILFSVEQVLYSQYININDGVNISNLIGNETSIEWSSDSRKILFQNVYNDTSRVYLYNLEEDTLINLCKPGDNFRNPVWHPDGDKIVFDTDIEGVNYLYLMDLSTFEMAPLFIRNIRCRNATFSGSSRQVYFVGYDEYEASWEIYSYDFIYDNLNKLTDYKLGCSNPDINTNGTQIVYSKANPFTGTEKFEIINWYGEDKINYNNLTGRDASWGSSGLKIFFISDLENESNELYSIWKDGTHLERLTSDDIEIANPAVSPDGTKLAISVFTESGWDVYILNFEDY